MLNAGHYKIDRYMANRSTIISHATRTPNDSSPLPPWAALPLLVLIILRLWLRPLSFRFEVLLYSRGGCTASLCALHSLQLLVYAVVVVYHMFLYCFVLTGICFLVPLRLGLLRLGFRLGQLLPEMVDEQFLLPFVFLYYDSLRAVWGVIIYLALRL